MIEALRQYAEKAQNGQRLQRRLFTEDAVRGFAFVDLCHKRYDVVLMNPPFGAPTASGVSALDHDAANNLYSAFVIRAFQQCTGFIGAITDRTFFVQDSFKRYRFRLLSATWSLRLAVDLGWGVLDTADVQVAAYVLSNQGGSQHLFLDLREVADKSDTLATILTDVTVSRVRVLTESHFRHLPNRVFAYSLPQVIFDLFVRDKSLSDIATLPRGLGSNKAFRTYRVWFEVPQGSIGAKKRWRTLSNGGDFSPFFREDAGVADWLRHDGAQLVSEGYDDGFKAYDQKNIEHYFEAGLSFPKQSTVFNVAVLSADAIPTREGKAIVPHQQEDIWFLLGYLNSSLVRRIVEATSGLHKQSGSIGLLPVPKLSVDVRSSIALAARRFSESQFSNLNFDETSRFFQCPKCLLQGADDALVSVPPYLAIDDCIFDAMNIAIDLRESLRCSAPDVPLLFTPSNDDLVSFALGCRFGRWSYKAAISKQYCLLDPMPDEPPAMKRYEEEGMVAREGILVDDPESSTTLSPAYTMQLSD